jgi:hypothetical protein
MKPLTYEWVEKAEGDLRSPLPANVAENPPTMTRRASTRNNAAEKCSEGAFQEADIPFDGHNLTALLDLLPPIELLWEALRPHLRTLTVLLLTSVIPENPQTKWRRVRRWLFCRVRRRALKPRVGGSITEGFGGFHIR